ncbi:MAG: hypothetical protein Q9212_005456 [Teloschistes hypoglaucus]
MTITNITADPGPPIKDPYWWHEADMQSTWEFFDFRSRVPERTCEDVFFIPLADAHLKILQGKAFLPVRSSNPLRNHLVWSRIGSPDNIWFDLHLDTPWKLTWRMLTEALPDFTTLSPIWRRRKAGIKLACKQGKEFHFSVFKGREVVTQGWLMRRRS